MTLNVSCPNTKEGKERSAGGDLSAWEERFLRGEVPLPKPDAHKRKPGGKQREAFQKKGRTAEEEEEAAAEAALAALPELVRDVRDR